MLKNMSVSITILSGNHKLLWSLEKMGKVTNIVLLCLLVLITGCALLGKDSEKQAESAGEEAAVEVDRKEITEGMYIEDVKGILGDTQNILVDRKGRSVMLYDRLSAIEVKREKDTLVLIGLVPDDDTSEGRKKFRITIRLDSDSQVDDFDIGPSRF